MNEEDISRVGLQHQRKKKCNESSRLYVPLHIRTWSHGSHCVHGLATGQIVVT